MKVYFASPFFNPEQVERERRLVNVLRQQGFEVYAPSESCVLKPDASQAERDQVFQDNINHLKSADLIFAVTDAFFCNQPVSCRILRRMRMRSGCGSYSRSHVQSGRLSDCPLSQAYRLQPQAFFPSGIVQAKFHIHS